MRHKIAFSTTIVCVVLRPTRADLPFHLAEGKLTSQLLILPAETC